MSLHLFNTMSRELEEFVPITPGFCGFYGCGPTVYNYAHIGNLRAYVFLDTLDRALTALGYKKRHVMNITDIGHLSGDNDEGEDKMLRSARERHQSVLEIADFYTKAFFRDIDALNIIRPDVVCRATDHIPEMIALIKRLEERGHTYRAGGNVYYDVSTFPEYGRLAHQSLNRLRAGARVEVDSAKRDPLDFVLWFTRSKFARQALTWDSPWGRGYPGWHIECSAMSMKYLGEHFDIHTGGVDHIKIHHTNEIAQSEGATGKRWVNYWLHNEFLVIRDAKMSKSEGNFLTLGSLRDAGYEPLDFRYFLLGTHYRKQIYYSAGAMDTARSARRALVSRARAVFEREKAEGTADGTPALEGRAAGYMRALREAIEDDLATPRVLGVLQNALRDTGIAARDAAYITRRADSVLGLNIEESAARTRDVIELADDDREIARLVEERSRAKAAGNYARADEIRRELASLGVQLTDTPAGTTWTAS